MRCIDLCHTLRRSLRSGDELCSHKWLSLIIHFVHSSQMPPASQAGLLPNSGDLNGNDDIGRIVGCCMAAVYCLSIVRFTRAIVVVVAKPGLKVRCTIAQQVSKLTKQVRTDVYSFVENTRSSQLKQPRPFPLSRLHQYDHSQSLPFPQLFRQSSKRPSDIQKGNTRRSRRTVR